MIESGIRNALNSDKLWLHLSIKPSMIFPFLFCRRCKKITPSPSIDSTVTLRFCTDGPRLPAVAE